MDGVRPVDEDVIREPEQTQGSLLSSVKPVSNPCQKTRVNFCDSSL
jgi:hypothetical protein